MLPETDPVVLRRTIVDLVHGYSDMSRTGVVLMTYGSPRDLDDVARYITSVRGGREPSEELLVEFRRRYARIGMSPLIDITQQQAAGLDQCLGADFVVAAGMRFSEPSVAAAVHSLGPDVERIVGVILSPQYSATLMGGYQRALSEAAGDVPCRTVGAWHLNPAFIDVLASRIRAALARFPDEQRARVPVLLTAHSLPRRVVDREPDYVEQLKDTAQAVADKADLAADRGSSSTRVPGTRPRSGLSRTCSTCYPSWPPRVSVT